LAAVSLGARESWHVPSWPEGIGAILFLALAGSVVTFVTWQWLLKTAEATSLSFVALITPITAVLLGAGVGNEKFDAVDLVGSAIVLAGIYVSISRRVAGLGRALVGRTGPQLLRDRQGPCVLPEDERPLPPDPLGLNRLVGRGVFDHTVRVDPGFVGERVVADERLRDPERDAAQPFDELGEFVQAGDFDPGVVFVQGLER